MVNSSTLSKNSIMLPEISIFQSFNTAYLSRRIFYEKHEYDKKIKNLNVITGQGEMQKEFLGWVNADPFASSAKNVDNNKGAWAVTIKKHKPKNKQKLWDSSSVLNKLKKYFLYFYPQNSF